MDDSKILDLYFERSEAAIHETDIKYGRLLRHIAYNILHTFHDSLECVDDAYMKAWETIPPERPQFFKAYLSKITRNISINRYNANRRVSSINTGMALDELEECIPAASGDLSDDIDLRDAINDFLASLGQTQRQIFVKRYFYMMTVREIAKDMYLTESNVKVTLMRVRDELRDHLEKAGITI